MKQLAYVHRLVGEDNLGNVILVTTMLDSGEHKVLEKREKDLERTFWEPFLTRGATMARSNAKDETGLVDVILKMQKTVLALQGDLVDAQRTLPKNPVREVAAADLSRQIAKKERAIGHLKQQLRVWSERLTVEMNSYLPL